MVQSHLRDNGDVTPCDFAPFVFGNIREKPLGQIWHEMSVHEVFANTSKRCRLANPRYWTRCAEWGLSRETPLAKRQA